MQGKITIGRARSIAEVAVAVFTALVATLVLALSAAPAHAAFGVAAFDQQITADAAGDPFTQAGGHPYEITTEIDFNTHPDPNGGSGAPNPDADAKDVIVNVPPGLVGNAVAPAQCTQKELAGPSPHDPPVQGIGTGNPVCPIDSVVGTITLRSEFGTGKPWEFTVPVYNMTPPSNAPALFGFSVLSVPLLIEANVRNGGDFGVVLKSTDIPQALPLDGFTLRFWGVPADPSHDVDRCDGSGGNHEVGTAPEPVCPGEAGLLNGPHPASAQPSAFLTMPVACPPAGEGLLTTMSADSWVQPGAFVEETLHSHVPPGYPAAPGEWGASEGTTGCDRVPFAPSIAVAPTTSEADTPTGLNIDISLPQEGLTSPKGLGTSDVSKTVVTLPEGVAVSPSAAAGLQACAEAEIGLGSGAPAQCPSASKLGTVEIVTPLLSRPLQGFVYLAKQGQNPFGSLLALYLVAEGNGVVLKLAGQVALDPSSGQLTTTFDNSPQLPFSELKVSFNGGPRAPLVNPHSCGTYTADARLTPWSGNAPADASSSFQITSGPHGSACPSGRSGFAPRFQAGTTSIQAGGFSPFTLGLFREDGEQQIGELEIKTPPGLLGTLANVPLCPEPLAAQGECPASSQIGTLSVGAGAGANPVYVYGGKVFLTTSYKGSQFGLSIVQEAVAGPFDLGRVVVRGQITVDPHTAALTITSDPLPTALQGIPLDLRAVNVSIDRPNFMFNPTNCSPMAVAGTLTSGQGSAEQISSPFQVTNCAVLGFAPQFKVSTSGRTSRLGGASLDARIVYPKGAQANIAKVKVALPKQLPSRLTTLQKACPAATFDANPGDCSAASVVGIAKAHTPVLPVTLTGPVYFVSNGGEAFPNLVVVLQGYGVRVDLVGDTFISKAGITSTTFKTVPDVPIESFELYLPQGPHSALAANGNLCKSKLKMPTAFTAQNGAVLNQSTPIAVTGCGKAKRKAKQAGRARRVRASRHAHRRARGARHDSGGNGNRRSK